MSPRSVSRSAAGRFKPPPGLHLPRQTLPARRSFGLVTLKSFGPMGVQLGRPIHWNPLGTLGTIGTRPPEGTARPGIYKPGPGPDDLAQGHLLQGPVHRHKGGRDGLRLPHSGRARQLVKIAHDVFSRPSPPTGRDCSVIRSKPLSAAARTRPGVAWALHGGILQTPELNTNGF